MSPRLVMICLALLVLVYAILPVTAAPHELKGAELLVGDTDTELGASALPPSSEPGKPKQRTFFLLLPLLFPDQYY